MRTLGINAAFHDSAACLVQDGIVLAAAEEERFTGIKHAKRPVPFSAWELPFHAIHYCLEEAGLCLDDVDHIAYSFNPDLLLQRAAPTGIIELPLAPGYDQHLYSPWEALQLCYIANAPKHLRGGVPHHLSRRFRRETQAAWHFVSHHVAHAASAFLPAPFSEAAILTADGRGESATTACFDGRENRLEQLSQVDMPHSLGLLYEHITEHLGFLHSSDEYKVMALASYGKPHFLHKFRTMIEILPGGSYRIHEPDLSECFGPKRRPGETFECRHFDIAASLQSVLEETLLELCSWLKAASGRDNLCLAGGVALNCVANAKIRDSGLFERIWVQPAAGDAGTALGAALLVDAETAGRRERTYTMHDVYLGPGYSDEEIENNLRRAKLPYRRLQDVPGETAELLLQDKIVGWFQGRMEFGPRALGARSILASPLHAAMQDRLNELKDREDFRPVAPVTTEEDAPSWFRGCTSSPFMLFVHDVLPHRAPLIPAVTHVDGSARVQTVTETQNKPYYNLIRAFEKLSGVPVLVNTSFNTKGKPIVCTPADAIESFYTSPLDALVIGSFLLTKQAEHL